MARVTTPVKGFTGTVVGVTFVEGVGETDNPAALGYFARRGYTIEAEEAPPFPDGKPAKAWKVDELKAYAARHGVDLGEAKSKDEILAVLTPADAGAGKTPSGDPAGAGTGKTVEV